MAEIKVSALPAATAPDGTEVVPVVQGGVTKRIPVGAAGGLATLLANGKHDPAQSATLGLATNSLQIGPLVNNALETNRAYYWRLVSGGVAISKIGLRVVTSSGNVSVAAYSNTGSGRTSAPGPRLATSGAVPCPAIGDAELFLGATVTVNLGDWFGLSADNAVVAMHGPMGAVSIGLYAHGRVGYQDAAHPCPAVPAISYGLTGAAYLVGVP